MPLESIQLDDLTWADLTTAARERIAGASGGQWTLHAPVDPGITLLELFAAQLEQRLYWMNQTSDSTQAAMLSLLGIKPRPVNLAGTVLCLLSDSDESLSLPEPPLVFEQASGERPLRFTSQERLQLLPVQWQSRARRTARSRTRRAEKLYELDVRLSVAGQDYSDELRNGNLPCMLSTNGESLETQIAFPLVAIPSGNDPISIFIELDTPASIQPQWHNDDSVGDFGSTLGEKSPLIWKCGVVASEYPFGHTVPMHSLTTLVDGTWGLRRSGVIQFNAIDFGAAQYQFQPGALWVVFAVQDRSPTRSFLPRVRQILPNAVLARHRYRYTLADQPSVGTQSHENSDSIRKQIQQWRALPGNHLALPVREGEYPIPSSVKLKLLERGHCDLNSWEPTDRLAHLGPIDRNFIVDRDHASLRFGDGLNGRLPIAAQVVTGLFEIEYEVGGGVIGNLPAWQPWRLSRESSPHITAFNVVPAQGGDDAESVAETVRRSKAELRSVHRAITKDDIERIACKTEGAAIKRAYAAVGLHPQYSSLPVPGAVTVFVVPELPQSLRDFLKQSCGDNLIALKPDDAALRAVAESLDSARVLTQEIFVAPPVYEQVSIKVTLVGAPAEKETTQDVAIRALHVYLHPLFGGPDGNGWPFGAPLRPSELTRILIEVIDAELTVKEVEIGQLASIATDHIASRKPCCSNSHHNSEPVVTAFYTCNDMPIRPHALVELRHVEIEFISQLNTVGGLR